jgi:uncharacterized protein DUF4236
MGFRFNRRIRIFPGVRLNLSKSGVSASIGSRGAWLTFGKRGTRATVGLPGTGLSYTHLEKPGHPAPAEASTELLQTSALPTRRRAVRGWIWLALLVAIALTIATLAGCVTEQGHIHQTTLPGGQPGYAITCNSQRYDRCLNRATRVCGGPYTIVPQERSSTFRPGDRMPGVGNSELILVACGN